MTEATVYHQLQDLRLLARRDSSLRSIQMDQELELFRLAAGAPPAAAPPGGLHGGECGLPGGECVHSEGDGRGGGGCASGDPPGDRGDSGEGGQGNGTLPGGLQAEAANVLLAVNSDAPICPYSCRFLEPEQELRFQRARSIDPWSAAVAGPCMPHRGGGAAWWPPEHAGQDAVHGVTNDRGRWRLARALSVLVCYLTFLAGVPCNPHVLRRTEFLATDAGTCAAVLRLQAASAVGICLVAAAWQWGWLMEDSRLTPPYFVLLPCGNMVYMFAL